MTSFASKRRRRYGLLAATVVTLIAIAPQLYFCFQRGSQWNGSYAQTHGDESVYAAYLNSLIDGRPRRNNPYTGRDDQQLAESYLSVQAFPPVLLANFARFTHLSTAKLFMGLTAIVAFAAAAGWPTRRSRGGFAVPYEPRVHPPKQREFCVDALAHPRGP